MKALAHGISVFAMVAMAATVAIAQQPLLNSERIEQTFGSYGIDVVYSDGSLRLSNLYSLHDDRKVTRTFAIVVYPTEVHARIKDAHAAILAGGSIGATLTAAGWNVVKTDHRYFSVSLPPFVADAMQQDKAAWVAAHAYRLSVDDTQQRFDYAVIIEIHHADYLRLEDLRRIYGNEGGAGLSAATRGILANALAMLSAL